MVYQSIVSTKFRTMVNKSKKNELKKSNRNDSAGEKSKKKKPTSKVVQRRDGKSKTKNLVDIFNEHAIINAYYTCHNVQDLLKIRGFPWPELLKKKKKSKKQKFATGSEPFYEIKNARIKVRLFDWLVVSKIKMNAILMYMYKQFKIL